DRGANRYPRGKGWLGGVRARRAGRAPVRSPPPGGGRHPNGRPAQPPVPLQPSPSKKRQVQTKKKRPPRVIHPNPDGALMPLHLLLGCSPPHAQSVGRRCAQLYRESRGCSPPWILATISATDSGVQNRAFKAIVRGYLPQDRDLSTRVMSQEQTPGRRSAHGELDVVPG